ncbi:hypothetical protein FLONG3_5345 [Fusarium longipes]|uniref:Heterokaryon incompatibility domain-containing protein n=1 Tax=Fusarium longipes TaxID=694270 RepID=A0A395SW09_9HYPO|nr:hypothetical protein FLONG3_5345 [Fusarium longipes]
MNIAEPDGWHHGEETCPSATHGFVISAQATRGAVAMLKREWWSRVWTVQEMILAPTVIFMCGSLAASAPDVEYVCNSILMHTVSEAFDANDAGTFYDLGDLISDPDGKFYIAKMRLHRTSSIKKELGTLLCLHRWLRAKDPRDKVYGCLGIAASLYGIEPDYTISTVECYTRAAFKIISGSRSLEIFSALRTPSCLKGSLTELPSWVPDWSYDFTSIPDQEKGPSGINNPIIRENVRTPILIETRDAFPEWKASKSNLSFTTRLLEDRKTLILKGFILDKVSSVGDKLVYPFPGPELSSDDVVADLIHELKRTSKIWAGIGGVIHTIKGWQDLAFKTPDLQLISGESRMDAFLTTLVSNRIRRDADRRNVLEYLEKSVRIGFEMPTSGKILNQLFISQIAPKLYFKLLGYIKLHSIDWSDMLSVGKSFTDIQWAFDHKIAITSSGYLCLVPWATESGDRIALLQGGRTPYVFRKAEKKWNIIGDCYVHGIMSGEAWSDDRCVDMEII